MKQNTAVKELKIHPINISLPDTGFLRLPDVLAVIPISGSLWYEWIAQGKAPEPTQLSPRVVAWKVREIRELIKKLEDDGDVIPDKSSMKRIKRS